ncbi:peptidoglycan-binding domain-containing protein [Tunturiibacter gelidiferens]|uniref:peptidoglycan-binding domain-containing protein n=1 Tax=Tunturiibacter gelidiferens TaxID=3069689 RepID=UPI003D9B369A
MDTSQWVPWAQACLARLVGAWVPQDGIVGPDTRRAIQMFQGQQQLPVTGILDSQTVGALQAACARQLPPPAPFPSPSGADRRTSGTARHASEWPPDSPDQTGEMEEAKYSLEQPEYGEQESMLNDMQEIALAAELSGITSEQELEQFLGDLIQDIGRSVKGFANSPAGQTVGGILKSAAKQILPIAGKAVGNYFGGSSGAGVGSQLGSAAAQLFGLEVGEMSQEDREFETARKFVRFARHAVKRAVDADDDLPPFERGKQAVVEASRQYAPGLVDAVEAIPDKPGTPPEGQSQQQLAGRWVRRGNNIIIHSV